MVEHGPQAKNAKGVLNKITSLAVRREYITRNPAREVVAVTPKPRNPGSRSRKIARAEGLGAAAKTLGHKESRVTEKHYAKRDTTAPDMRHVLARLHGE